MTAGEKTLTPARAEPARPPEEPRSRRRRPSAETAGYLVLALGLGALLWANVRNVDHFYLDEWFYVHGAAYMWDNLPGALFGTIPEWTRGPQRLYSMLLALPYGLFGRSTAFAVGHLLNVALLVSGVVPLALLARRVIATPALRVLAVALAVALPWLMIASHLLTENLAFPLFLWSVYAIVRAAETPSVWTQLAALGAIGAMSLCRLNLSTMFGVLLLAVVAVEPRRRGEQGWLRQAARRNAVVLLATGLAAAVAVLLLSGSTGALGDYGGFSLSTVTDGLFGAGQTETARALFTYARGMVQGTFVLPVVLGLAVALAGAAGRLGHSFVVPALVALGGLIAVLVTVSLWTKGAALEERYAFYPVAPLAVLAVAGVEQARRLRGWIAAGGVLALWAVVVGSPWPGTASEHFFSGPGKAFWSRVLDWRLRHWEDTFLGWTLLAPTGWLLVAVGLVVLVATVSLARRRPRVITALLSAGLALCLVAQVLALNYDLRRELYGTSDQAGGIAMGPGHEGDREDWVDERLPGGARAALLPGLAGSGTALGGAEQVQFWNRRVDHVVGIGWNGTAVLTPPGIASTPATPDADGLAAWPGPPRPFLVAMADDPRVQFPGRVVARSPRSRYALYRLDRAERAAWTAVGLDGDGAVLENRPAALHLDRAAVPAVRTVELTFSAPAGSPAPERWRIARGRRVVASGTLAGGRVGRVRLEVPPCTGACRPVGWRLSARGGPVGLSFPAFGPQSPPRPVTLFLVAARLTA